MPAQLGRIHPAEGVDATGVLFCIGREGGDQLTTMVGECEADSRVFEGNSSRRDRLENDIVERLKRRLIGTE